MYQISAMAVADLAIFGKSDLGKIFGRIA